MKHRTRMKWFIFVDDMATLEQWDRAEPALNGWEIKRTKRQALRYADKMCEMLQCPMMVYSTRARDRALRSGKMIMGLVVEPRIN